MKKPSIDNRLSSLIAATAVAVVILHLGILHGPDFLPLSGRFALPDENTGSALIDDVTVLWTDHEMVD